MSYKIKSLFQIITSSAFAVQSLTEWMCYVSGSVIILGEYENGRTVKPRKKGCQRIYLLQAEFCCWQCQKCQKYQDKEIETSSSLNPTGLSLLGWLLGG